MVHKNRAWVHRHPRTLLRRLHSLWFCLLAVMLLVTNKSMAVIYQVGTGTASITTSGITPYTTFWHDNRIQYLYLASELTGLGASTGNITSVAFNFTSLGSPSPANVNIKMTLIPAGTTNISSLTLSGLTTVYSAATVTPTLGWNTYILSTPYLWDGTSNILVEVCRDNSSYSSSYGVQCTNLGSGVSRTFGYYADGVAGCSMTSGSSASAINRQNRPNMQFDITSSSPCTGTPVPGNTLASQNPVCPAVSFNLSLQNSTPGSGVDYQWQSSTDGGLTWTNFGTNAGAQTLSQTVETMYQCIVTCTNSLQSDISNPVTVTMTPFYSCYCSSSAYNTGDEDITEVEVGSMINSSTCSTTGPGPGSVSSRYANYQGFVTPATVSQGQAVAFDIKLEYCDYNAYYNIAAMYIDYDQDGIYNPSTELVATKPYGIGTVPSFQWTNNFTVPLTATVGTTGMRIVFVEGSTVSPCGTYGWGETEDYLITIVASNNCTGTPAASNTQSSVTNVCPSVPFNLSLSYNYTEQGLTFQWQSSTDGGLTWTNFGSNNPYESASLTVNTMYQCIITCTNSGFSTTSTPAPVNVNPFYTCYCTPVYTIYDNDYISNVTLNTINNTTGYAALPGYTDYSGTLQTNLLQGQPYTINVTNGGGYSEYVAAWIDFNQDGTFDASEQLLSVSAASGATVSNSFTVPMSSASGITRLRVTLQYGGSGTPCPTSGYGEAEDYGINVVVPVACSGTPAPGNTVASVNPACFLDNLVLSTSNAMTDLGLTFDWQTSPDGITWTSSGVTTPTYTVNQSAATYYQCVVTCTNTGFSGTSTPLLVNQTVCYCTTPVYSYNAGYDMCSYYNYIGNFTFAGINNTTICDNTPPYYNYYSGMTATVDQTGSYQVTISATPGGASFQLYKVYIDYNDNGSFDDAGEMVYTSGFISSATNYSQGYINIPLTAPLGTHRLRVRSTNPLNSGYDANSCSEDGYLGEVEDYNITINPAPPCSGTPTPGATLSNKTLACSSTTITLSLENVTPGTGVTYQWQSAPDAGFSTITNLGTSDTQTATQTATTYYRCLVTCSGNTGISTPVMVYYTSNCYCIEPAVVSDGCALGLYINNVTFAGINNTSGCYNPVPYTYPFYSFFPSQTASVTQGGVYPFSASAPNQATPYYQWYGVWIDYNDNGSFEDAGELVLSSVNGANATNNILTGNITIPLSATPGVHLMRVRSANVSAAINSCTDNAVSGETEDYLIDILAAPACAGTPNPGNTLPTDLNVCSTDNITLSLQNNPIETGYSYQWQVSTVSATGPWTNIGPNANTYTTTQSVTTWYQCVVTCTNSMLSTTSTPVQVNQNAPTACYCAPSYTSYDNDYISNVTLNTINNTTGYAALPSYTDYSGTLQTNLLQGQLYTIYVTNGGGYTENVGAWIDFNQDGSFDAGEQVLNTTAGSGLAVSNSFTVPLSAVSGNTILRVTLQYGLAATPCPTSGWGEAEDYGIILGDPNCISSPTAPANASLICPDPGLVLSWPSMSGATGYDVYFDNVAGTTLVSPNQSGTTYNPGTLSGTGPFYWKVVPLYPSDTCNMPVVWSFSLKPGPIPGASSGGDVCEGGSITLTGDNLDPGQMSGNTFAWTGPNGFTSTNQYPTISNAGSVNAGTYTLVVTNQFGCSGADSTIVNVNPNPVLTIIDYQNVGCIGGSDGEVTIGASGGTANYDFTYDFVNYINDPAQATITNLPTGTSVIYVSDANACQSTIPVTLTYISAAPPAQNVIMPFVGMPGNACPGTTANLSIPAVAGATMYTWDGPPGTTFDGNPSPYISTSPSATIVFGTPNTSLYNIGVQAGNGCGNSIRKIQKVRYSVSVPESINGDATVCANTNGKVYSIPAAPEGATSYQWTITGDASINGQGNSATTSSLNVTIDFGPSWNGGTLCVAAKTSCYTSAYKCFPISTASGNFGVITGPFTACANSIENYSVTPGTGVANYNWTVPANSSVSSGQGTNAISVFYQPGYNTVGQLCVTATSICGVVSVPKCKTVAPSLPTRPSSISGISNGLCGSSNVAYSTPIISGVTYSWTVPTGASIASGNGTSSINVNYGSFTNGQVCVTSHNSCGFSLPRCIVVKGAPNTPASITADPSSWCAYDAGIEFTADVSNVTGIYTLSWAYPSTTTYVQGGGNSTSLTLDWGGSNGVVRVTSSNSCGNATQTYNVSLGCRESEMSASALNVYPNPTAGMLNVEYTTEKGTAQVTVFDLSGRVVMTQTQSASEGKNTMQLDLSKVAKGAYMLNVQTHDGNNQVRFVVE